MRTVRVGYLAPNFTHFELSGWSDELGIAYGDGWFAPIRQPRRRRIEEATPVTPPRPVEITSGKLLTVR